MFLPPSRTVAVAFSLRRRRNDSGGGLVSLLPPSPKDLHRRGDRDGPPAQNHKHGVLLLPLGRVRGREPGVGYLRLAVGV